MIIITFVLYELGTISRIGAFVLRGGFQALSSTLQKSVGDAADLEEISHARKRY